jgi:hypothetical protein
VQTWCVCGEEILTVKWGFCANRVECCHINEDGVCPQETWRYGPCTGRAVREARGRPPVPGHPLGHRRAAHRQDRTRGPRGPLPHPARPLFLIPTSWIRSIPRHGKWAVQDDGAALVQAGLRRRSAATRETASGWPSCPPGPARSQSRLEYLLCANFFSRESPSSVLEGVP